MNYCVFLVIFVVGVFSAEIQHVGLQHVEVKEQRKRLFSKDQNIVVTIKGNDLNLDRNSLYFVTASGANSCECSDIPLMVLPFQAGNKGEIITKPISVEFKNGTCLCFKETAASNGRVIKKIPPYIFHQNVVPAVALFVVTISGLCLTLNLEPGSVITVGSGIILTYLLAGLDGCLEPLSILFVLFFCLTFIYVLKEETGKTVYGLNLLTAALWLFNLRTHMLDPYFTYLVSFGQHCLEGVTLFGKWLAIPLFGGCVFSLCCSTKFPLRNFLGLVITCILGIFQWNDSWPYICVTSCCSVIFALITRVLPRTFNLAWFSFGGNSVSADHPCDSPPPVENSRFRIRNTPDRLSYPVHSPTQRSHAISTNSSNPPNVAVSSPQSLRTDTFEQSPQPRVIRFEDTPISNGRQNVNAISIVEPPIKTSPKRSPQRAGSEEPSASSSTLDINSSEHLEPRRSPRFRKRKMEEESDAQHSVSAKRKSHK